LEVTGHTISLIDLGSAQGTFVNEEKINKKLIEPGDFIRCAGTQILFVSVER
jgi:pSer/pThr/pTyr-binding forkhead associated (FHA) protein